ncbi:hypothetical protein D3C84_857540 [compost metagenome]
MDREFHGNAAGIANARLDPLRKFQMVTVARGQVAASLGDANDRAARLQLFTGHAVVHVAFDIQGSHVGVGRVVEPLLTAQAALGGVTHDSGLSCHWMVRQSVAVSAGEQSSGGEVAQQGADAKGPRRGLATVGDLVVQAAQQRTADADPVT